MKKFSERKMLDNTERLTFRRWLDEDLPRFIEIYYKPEVNKFIGGPPKENDYQAYLAKFQNRGGKYPDLGAFAACLKESGKIIGSAAICPLKDGEGNFLEDIEIGWTLDSEFWGKGYATELGLELLSYAKSLSIAPIHAVVNPENTKSSLVCKRLGMFYTGRTQKYYGMETELFIFPKPVS